MRELFEQLMEKMKKEMEGVVRETMLEVLRDEKKYEYPERVSVSQASEITGYSKNSLYHLSIYQQKCVYYPNLSGWFCVIAM